MANDRLPLLRGRISSVDTYQSPIGGGSALKLPSLDPLAHRARLLAQLDAMAEQVRLRPEATRDELAVREIVVVHPAQGAKLTPDQLSSVRADARLIGTVEETGDVLLDVADVGLGHLRAKLDAFADDALVTTKTDKKDGSTTSHRDKERAVAPIGGVALAEIDDIRGPILRAHDLVSGRRYWFEIGCRGGYRSPSTENVKSRSEILRQLHRIGAIQQLDEFVAPERIYFFVRVTREQLEALLSATDCIYEVELAPPAIRDLKLLDDVTTPEVRDFKLEPPDAAAPAVVVLDTGVATAHPLLKDAILSATTAGPEIPSAEDTYGHGTKMAGVVLYSDLGNAIESGRLKASHWLQSSRLIVQPQMGLASDENYDKWPIMTLGAVLAAEKADTQVRDRVFALAITRSMQDPPLDGIAPTLWSHAADQIAYHDGRGRLLVVAAGNARDAQWVALSEQHPQLQLSEKIHQPGQSANVVTVGAFTARVELPNDADYAGAEVVAKRPGGLSPYTSTGLVGSDWPIKPDIMMEGGNLARSGPLLDASVPTLSALTTSHKFLLGQPLGQLSMTSEATARAAHLAARVWTVEPKLWPETVRALLAHSASWTPEMIRQFEGIGDRLQACGYGVPDERVARECAQDRATVIIEDEMPNAVTEEVPKKEPPKREGTKPTEPKLRRKVKVYRLPVPHELMTSDDPEVELRVTLSYFAEPNKFGRTVFRGLDLKWDMQGPQETEKDFFERINKDRRPKDADGKPLKVKTKESFDWQVGVQLRSRGTLQSDRWRGRMSQLTGDKLIAVVPVLGWWDQRKHLKHQSMRFSLVVSVFGPRVYAVIKPHVELPVEAEIDL